jgi:hypothetical protein
MRCDGWYVRGMSVKRERSGRRGQHQHVLIVDKVMEVTWEPKQAAERDGAHSIRGVSCTLLLIMFCEWE